MAGNDHKQPSRNQHRQHRPTVQQDITNPIYRLHIGPLHVKGNGYDSRNVMPLLLAEEMKWLTAILESEPTIELPGRDDLTN